MSDNEDNENENANEELEPSKLPKPCSVDHYFNKIDSNPKFIQLEAKLKPEPNNKITKFTYKTNASSISGKDLASNSKLKFETKEGKTKISVNVKMFDISCDKQKVNSQNGRCEKPELKEDIIAKREVSENFAKLDNVGSKLETSTSTSNSNNNNNNGDLDISFTTSYNNSRLNLRVKDKGELNAKLNHTIELIPNKLKSQVEYFYEFKNFQNTHKGALDLTLSTGVEKWVYKVEAKKKYLIRPTGPSQYYYSKSETKIKAKVNFHESELKLNTIAHFGELNNVDPVAILPSYPPGKEEIKLSISSSEKDQEDSLERLAYLSSIDEKISTKAEIENKLTFPHKSVREFNFKSAFKYEEVHTKKLYRIETIINQYGIHNIEGRYVWKFKHGHYFGVMLGANWNSHLSSWNKKWEITLEKQNLFKFKNYGLDFSLMGISVNDKSVGLKLQNKFKESSRVEMIVSKKWNSGSWWPNYGFKFNFNW